MTVKMMIGPRRFRKVVGCAVVVVAAVVGCAVVVVAAVVGCAVVVMFVVGEDEFDFLARRGLLSLALLWLFWFGRRGLGGLLAWLHRLAWDGLAWLHRLA